MTEHPARVPPPALAAGDVYVYAHANGAVSILTSAGRSRLVPLDEAVDLVTACASGGHRVRVGSDPGPLATDAIARLRDQGIPLDVVDGAPAPRTWDEGTTALMEAAAAGDDALLADLVARGAPVDHRDASGSTALHHAAANGSSHAIDVLVQAGLGLDDRNGDGFTPYRLAIATRQLATAQHLADLGADTGVGAGPAVAFPPAHRATLWAWLVIPALDVVAAVIVGVTLHPVAGVAVAALGLGVVRSLAPPREARAGGAPVRLAGTVLALGGLGRTRAVDLRQVTAAAISGATGRQAYLGGRWLLLDHPDGEPADGAVLRRLAVPEGELDTLAARFGRVLVVSIAGGHHEEAVRTIGDALSALGVDLSPTLRAQLARARRDARRP